MYTMGVGEIMALALALAVDAFAVAVAAGAASKETSFRQGFRLAWHFGLFQALMPVVGWYAGFFIQSWIEAYDHWVAFGLLFFVAQGMLRNAAGRHQEDEAMHGDPTRGMTLIMLSIATSIDALAVGLSLSMVKVSIWTPSLIIGLVAGLSTALGMYLGRCLGSVSVFGRYAEAVGGLVLILIGLNILYEHGVVSALL